MTKKLKKKFIRIAMLYMAVVFSVIFAFVHYHIAVKLNDMMDVLIDVISYNEGVFPEYEALEEVLPFDKEKVEDIISEETKAGTVYFTVWADENGNITNIYEEERMHINYEKIYECANNVIKNENERGWEDEYRYKINRTEKGFMIVFVNGEISRALEIHGIFVVFVVLALCAVIVSGIIHLLSEKVVKPADEANEKQKVFITDVSHELKTPLTLIMSNIDILEEETGKSEWIDDIRSKTERMEKLITELITFSKMEENKEAMVREKFDISCVLNDAVSEFVNVAKNKQKKITAKIDSGIKYNGNEEMIRRLISILMDNAIKYCDDGGEIYVEFNAKKYPVLIVENTYGNVGNIEIDRLFDRFYCADKSRTNKNSFGIGLSMAKAIVEKHNGEILGYKKDSEHIGFKVILK